MPYFCDSYCSHGGRCGRRPGHKGLHDANGKCTWTDAEALTREQADAVLARTAEGRDFLATGQVIFDVLEGIYDDGR